MSGIWTSTVGSGIAVEVSRVGAKGWMSLSSSSSSLLAELRLCRELLVTDMCVILRMLDLKLPLSFDLLLPLAL